MKILERIKRKKKTEEKKKGKEIKAVREPSELEVLCGGDKEVYDALSYTLLLKPPSGLSMEQILENARRLEESKDLSGAGLQYRSAGQLSLFRGDLKGVREFFTVAQRLTGKEYLILNVNVLEKAVAKAQEYYQIQTGKVKQPKP